MGVGCSCSHRVTRTGVESAVVHLETSSDASSARRLAHVDLYFVSEILQSKGAKPYLVADA